MASNKKNERLKSLEKKYYKAQKQSFRVALLIICSGYFRKLPQNVLTPETCGVTKDRPHHAVCLL